MPLRVKLRARPSDAADRALRRELEELRGKIAIPTVVSGAAGHAKLPPESSKQRGLADDDPFGPAWIYIIALAPPSTTRWDPVTHFASSEAR